MGFPQGRYEHEKDLGSRVKRCSVGLVGCRALSNRNQRSYRGVPGASMCLGYRGSYVFMGEIGYPKAAALFHGEVLKM